MEDLENVIRRFIVQEILFESDEEVLDFEEPLLETSILDSAGLLHLVIFLDEKFDISIPRDDLVPENFETIRATSSYVRAKTASAESLTQNS